MNILANGHLIEIRVVVEYENALVAGIGNIGLLHAKFLIRTHHALAGNSAQLALLYLHVGHVLVVVAGRAIQRNGDYSAHEHVLCGSYYLYRRFLADFKLADPQGVGVGVLFHCDALSDYYVGDVCALLCPCFDLAAAHSHSVAEFFYRHIGFNVIVKPLH